METERGGFYINSGHLQYKEVLSSYEQRKDADRTPKPRKVREKLTSNNMCKIIRFSCFFFVKFQRIRSYTSTSSDGDESEQSTVIENGHHQKKPKINKDKTKLRDNKTPKNDLKEAESAVNDLAKDSSKKEFKTITVKDMLRAQRDRQQNNSDANSYKTSSQEAASSSDDSNSDDSTTDSSSGKEPATKANDMYQFDCISLKRANSIHKTDLVRLNVKISRCRSEPYFFGSLLVNRLVNQFSN